jgi:hypothetical protein
MPKIIRISGSDAWRTLAFIEKNALTRREFTLQPQAGNAKQTRADSRSKDALLEKYKIKPRYAHFKKFYNPSSVIAEGRQAITNIKHARDVLDEGMLLYFAEPHSFTGEDVVEIHCHGGRAVQAKLLSELSKFPNFRMAEAVNKRFSWSKDLLIESLSFLV